MPALDAITHHAVPYFLVLARLAGLFILAPLLAGVAVPMRIKALLVLMLAAAVYPMTPAPPPPELSRGLWGLLPLLVTETAIGMVIGLLATIPVLAMDMAGVIIGQQMGFGLARVYNPELDTDADILGQLLFYLGLCVFLALGGLETMFLLVLRSFETTPPGHAGMSGDTLSLVVGVVTSGFELALRVSAPALGIVFLLMVLFGVLSKTIPQLNTMTVGFTVKIAAGLLLTAAALNTIAGVAAEHIQGAMDAAERWTAGVPARPVSTIGGQP